MKDRLPQYGPDIVGMVLGLTLGTAFLLLGGRDTKDGVDGMIRTVDFGLSCIGGLVFILSGLGFLASREIRHRKRNIDS